MYSIIQLHIASFSTSNYHDLKMLKGHFLQDTSPLFFFQGNHPPRGFSLRFSVLVRRPARFRAVELDALHREAAAALPAAGGQEDVAREAGAQDGVLGH